MNTDTRKLLWLQLAYELPCSQYLGRRFPSDDRVLYQQFVPVKGQQTQ